MLDSNGSWVVCSEPSRTNYSARLVCQGSRAAVFSVLAEAWVLELSPAETRVGCPACWVQQKDGLRQGKCSEAVPLMQR